MGTSLGLSDKGESFNLAKIPPEMSVPMTMNMSLDDMSLFPDSYIIFNPSSSNPIKISCSGMSGKVTVKVTIPANTLITEKRVDIKPINSRMSYAMGHIIKITITY